MTNTVNNTQNNQQVNLNSFKVGQKINSCNTQKKKSIFNAIDKNNDGVISKDEMQGVVKGKVKNKEGKLVEKEYLKLKDMGEGRSLVVDANGKQWVRAKDGTILKDSYVKSGFKKTTNTPQKPATNSQRIAAANLGKAYKHAEAAFNKQLKDDGWAEDVADGISKLWNNDLFGGGTGNTASQVRKEMQAEKKRVLALQKAAKQSDSAFRTQFKKIYGVDYNQAAVDAYNKNPNEANYKKAFGTKIESIEQRVARYNQSQQTGGAAVKTGTKVAGGIAVGVATGGTGFVALGATALGTAAVSVAVEESDRANVTGTYKDASGKTVKQKGAFKEGTDHGKIFKDAAWDGAGVLAGGAVGAVAGKVVTGTTKAAMAGRAAINIGGDVAMGAAQEYAETGEVTASGVITNAAMSGIGSAVTSGVLQKGFKKVKNAVTGHADVTPSSAKVHTDTPSVPKTTIDTDVTPSSAKPVHTDAPSVPKTTIDTDVTPNTAHTDAGATPKTTVSADTDIKSRLNSAQSREEFVALRDEIKGMPNGAEKQALIQEYVKSERQWRMSPDRPDIRMQYIPETPDIHTAKAKPDIDVDAPATHAKTPDVPTASKPQNVKQSIMSSIEGSDYTLRTANLDDDAVQDEILAMLEKEIPSTRRVPGRVKTLKELQKLTNSPAYANMDDAHKELAKLAILQSNPRIDSRAMFDDLDISTDVKRKLKNIESCIGQNGTPETAAAMYHSGDIETLTEIARAKGMDEDYITKMQNAFNKAQNNGCLLVNQTEINTKNIPAREIVKDGKKFNLKVIDCTDPNTFSHPELYGLPQGTTADNMRMTVHMNDGMNKDPALTIGKMRQSDDLNLSGTVTDGKNTLYDNQQVGVVIDYDMGAVSYASNYAAGTGFCKTNTDFAKAKMSLNETSKGTFIRERFIQDMNTQGFDISTEDYITFSKKLQGKKNIQKELQAMAENGMININGKQVPIQQVEKSLQQSTDDLMHVSYEMRGIEVTNGFNEVNIYNPEIKALYVRANSTDATIESILSRDLLEYVQRRNLPIIFQRHVIQ